MKKSILFVIISLMSLSLSLQNNSPTQCDVYCTGTLLTTIQMSHIYNDSKTFVDMPLKYDPAVVIQNFQLLNNNYTVANLKAFLANNFYPAGSEVQQWTPNDWKSQPSLLNDIVDPQFKKFAEDLNAIWLDLGKQLSPTVYEYPQRFSFVPIPHPFIVPGGRFREFYYWDTYWILRGLLACEMYQSSKNTILNALALVSAYGFVPNGARIYYLTRSQPPLLSEMILTYYLQTQDKELLSYAVPLLEKEYNFWMTTHAVKIGDHVLNRYYANVDYPRPESYFEDFTNANGMSPSQTQEFYSDLVAAAESGMDFSSRWFKNGANLQSIKTRSIIPVDLNSILYKVESNILYFHQILNTTSPIDFEQAMKQRVDAMNTYMWDDEYAQWYDYDLDNMTQIKREYPTNFHPLWSGAYNESDNQLKSRIVDALKNSTLINPGGILTTTENSGQQWDSPNAWSPLESFVIFGLIRANTADSLQLAQDVATSWVRANLIGFQQTQQMHEKYNAFIPGQPGSGGEYTPQAGFGWTNGVVLELLQHYGKVIHM